jgi:hypothetical protein
MNASQRSAPPQKIPDKSVLGYQKEINKKTRGNHETLTSAPVTAALPQRPNLLGQLL